METLARSANRGSIATDTGYTIDNSFVQEYNSTRSVEVIYGGFSGSPPTTTKGTVSFWFKWGALNGGGAVWKLSNVYNSQVSIMPQGGTYDSSIYVAVNNESVLKLVSTAKFRDTSAWYHICAVFDTTLSTASDRVKIYINGVRITDWSTANYPSQNADLLLVKENTKHFAGHDVNAGKPYGYYAEMYYIHNQAKDVTDFGEFDSDTGIWKPIEYTGTFGSYGYHWDFSNASNLAEDQSGNDASTGQMTCSAFNVTSSMQSTDTPTNNFCTLNTNSALGIVTYTEGATVGTLGGTGDEPGEGTMAFTSGKWYYEASVPTSASTADAMFGFGRANYWGTTSINPGGDVYSFAYNSNNRIYYNNNNTESYGSGFSKGDIVSIAIDVDNTKFYVAVNGTWQNSADPAAGTGGWDYGNPVYTAPVIEGDSLVPAFRIHYNTYQPSHYNFGGYTVIPISSAASDENGYGTFEYAPPSGYYAICSKNLAEFG